MGSKRLLGWLGVGAMLFAVALVLRTERSSAPSRTLVASVYRAGESSGAALSPRPREASARVEQPAVVTDDALLVALAPRATDPPDEAQRDTRLRLVFHRESDPTERVGNVLCSWETVLHDRRSTGASDSNGVLEIGGLSSDVLVETPFFDRRVLTVEPGTLRTVLVPVPDPIVVSGRVLAPDGEPRVGADICVALRSNLESCEVVGESVYDGHFEVEIEAPSYVFARARHACRSNAILVDDVRATGALELRLTPAEDWSGVVLDAEGAPIAGAHVFVGSRASVRGPDEGGYSTGVRPTVWSDRTDASGRFEIRDVELGGKLPLTIVARGYAIASIANPVAREALEVRLDPELALHGIVTDDDGVPLVGAIIRWGDQATFMSASAWTDREGRFHLEGVPDAPLVELRAGRRGYQTRSIDVPFAMAEKDIEIMLSRR